MGITSGVRQTLIFDADDTLWENNIYFERAIDDFITYLNHTSLSPTEIRAVLDDIQRTNVPAYGYGVRNLGPSLRQTAERLHERELDEPEITTIMGFVERILSHPMEVIAGVEDTLTDLATRHDLALLTKGHEEDQRLKIERSGLTSYFASTFIVPEKDVDTYRTVANDLRRTTNLIWMIGNAPRSDINPALAAGLNAVFVPHPQTWSLEHQDLVPDAGPGKLLVIERFAELRQHF